jgi:hypothetical protein
MGRIADFSIKYAQTVFAIYPAFWEQGLIGWGIINKNAEIFGGENNAPIIHRSGVLKLFSTPYDAIGIDSLCEKIIAIWRNDFGYSKEPAVLVIEKPELTLKSPGKFSNVIHPSIFVGMLMCSLSPGLTLVPSRLEWTGVNNKPDTKADIENIVENINDYHSERVLKRDLEMIALHNRRQVYDALSIGIYGAEVGLGIKPMPMLHRRALP